MPIPTASGDFAAFFTALFNSILPVPGVPRPNMPHPSQQNQYVRPTAPQLASWRAVFQSLLAGDWDSAYQQAQTISSTYNVVQFLDTRTGRTYYVLMEGLPGLIPAAVEHPLGSVEITERADPTRRGWGTYVFDPQPQRALSLSAPHLFDDAETQDEAVEAFLALGARTLLLAGTDRDQNTALSPCDQERTPRPFREADVSHTAESVFQIAFEEIYSSDASTWHLQFHGNASTAQGCENVDVFLSNGVEAARDNETFDTLYTLSDDIAVASRRAAEAGGGVLMVDVYDDDLDCSLRGTTSMQMRFASGLPHASICHGDVMGPSRFIHVEQSRDARRRAPPPNDPDPMPGRNRGVIVAGILATFPPLSPAVRP
jgi:hypothetical protein